jgi:hypothetical protein
MQKNEATRGSSSIKKAWNKPQLRAVVPATHTRGGTGTTLPQEDASYRLS